MSLKSKIGKLKDFLLDEPEDEEKSSKKTFKKPFKKDKKMETTIEETSDISNDLFFEDVSETIEFPEAKQRVDKKAFEFPEFNDNDFMSRTNLEPEIDHVSPIIVEEPKPVLLYQGSKKKKEEVRRFKPSPVISPVYGLLDDKGQMATEVEEEEEPVRKEEMTFEEVRKVAFGVIDDDIKNIQEYKHKTIEEVEKESEEKEELSREIAKHQAVEAKKEEYEDNEEHKDRDDYEEDDGMIIPNINFKEIDIEKEKDSDKKYKKEKKHDKKYDGDEEDEDTKEQDLFNLIDSMYQGEEKED